jgi:hypothetical protein
MALVLLGPFSLVALSIRASERASPAMLQRFLF